MKVFKQKVTAKQLLNSSIIGVVFAYTSLSFIFRTYQKDSADIRGRPENETS